MNKSAVGIPDSQEGKGGQWAGCNGHDELVAVGPLCICAFLCVDLCFRDILRCSWLSLPSICTYTVRIGMLELKNSRAT